MNANEMSYQFDVLFDKIASFDSPGYTAKEKSVLLTKAQDIFIDKNYQDDHSEKSKKDFSEITNSVFLTSLSSSTTYEPKPNGVFFDVPDDLLYVKSEAVNVNSSNLCLNGYRVRVKPVRDDEYELQKHNPHKKPKVIGASHDLIWSLPVSDYLNTSTGTTKKRVQLISDGSVSIVGYYLTYLRKPNDIVPLLTGDSSTTTQSDCELGESSHREIVEIAIRIASGAIESQGYQIKLNEEKINN